MSRLIASTSVVAAVVSLLSCGEAVEGPRLHTFTGPTMGTSYTVKVVEDDLDDERRAALQRVIQSELDDVNAKMSHYLGDSELSLLNRWASDEPFTISQETFEVLEHALEVSRLTHGAFDITVGPLVNAWGFGPPGQPTEPPDQAIIERLLELTGWEHLELLPEVPAARKLLPELTMDLSAIAKGFAVDEVAHALASEDVLDFMVEIGGEVRTRGSNPNGNPWRIAIERPDAAQREMQLVIPLRDRSLATSGDYRNYYEVGGQRISHTIDPRNGWPITHAVASVSVVHTDCVLADAFATALLVLGPEGYELAEKLNLAAFYLARKADGDFAELETSAFAALVGD